MRKCRNFLLFFLFNARRLKVVEGEQVPRMRREREGLQRGEVQGAGLSICQGGELRHDVSGIPRVRPRRFLRHRAHMSFHISKCPLSKYIPPLHLCRRYNSTEGENWLIPMLKGERFAHCTTACRSSSASNAPSLMWISLTQVQVRVSLAARQRVVFDARWRSHCHNHRGRFW
jgi:hypothetical protein